MEGEMTNCFRSRLYTRKAPGYTQGGRCGEGWSCDLDPFNHPGSRSRNTIPPISNTRSRALRSVPTRKLRSSSVQSLQEFVSGCNFMQYKLHTREAQRPANYHRALSLLWQSQLARPPQLVSIDVLHRKSCYPESRDPPLARALLPRVSHF